MGDAFGGGDRLYNATQTYDSTITSDQFRDLHPLAIGAPFLEEVNGERYGREFQLGRSHVGRKCGSIRSTHVVHRESRLAGGPNH